jgi:MFS family permease
MHEGKTYPVYPRRFAIAGASFITNTVSNIIYNAFVPIFYYTEEYFGCANSLVECALKVNILVFVYNIFVLPGSLLASYCIDNIGIGNSLLVGNLFMVLASWMRYVGSLFADPVARYYTIAVAQSIAAFGQPLVTNIFPAITLSWFPSNERDYISAFLASSINVGIVLGSILPAYQVFSPSNSEFSVFLLTQAILSTGVAILSYMATGSLDGPPTPPALDSEMQLLIRLERREQKLSFFKGMMQVLVDWKRCLEVKNAVLVNLCVFFPIGIYWTFTGFAGQLMGNCNYNPVVIGWANAALSLAGVFGTIFIAFLLVKWRNYVLWFRIISFVSFASLIWLLFQIVPYTNTTSAILVIASWLVYGFITTPIISLSLELAAEVTFPVPPENSAAFIFLVLNYGQLVVGLGMTPLLTQPIATSCSTVFTPTAAIFFFFGLVGFLLTFSLKPEYKRMVQMKKTNECETCRNLSKICDCPEKVKEVEAASSDQQEKVVEVASDSGIKEELLEKPKSTKQILTMASGRSLSVKMS